MPAVNFPQPNSTIGMYKCLTHLKIKWRKIFILRFKTAEVVFIEFWLISPTYIESQSIQLIQSDKTDFLERIIGKKVGTQIFIKFNGI